MSCAVEFDLIESGFRHWGFQSSPLIFVVIGAGLLVWGSPIRVKILGLFYITFSLFFVYVDGSSYNNYLQYVQAYESGDFEIVEGRVEEYREEGEGARKVKFGTVGGQQFVVHSSAYLTNGYTEAPSKPAPFRAGRFLRISHVDGDIIRLESCA